MPRVPAAGGQGNGVVFPGRSKHAVARGLDVHGPSPLPSPRLAAHTRSHTPGQVRVLPSSLSSLPHPDRLKLRVRKLGAMNRDSRFKGKQALHTLGSLPVTSPTQQESLLPAVFPPHSPGTASFVPNILSAHGCRGNGIHGDAASAIGGCGRGWTQNLTTAGGTGLCGGDAGEGPDPALGQGSTAAGTGGGSEAGGAAALERSHSVRKNPPPDTSSLPEVTQAAPAHP